MLGTIKLGTQIICEDVPVWISEDKTQLTSAMGGIDANFVDEAAASHIFSAYSIQASCRLHLDDGRVGNIIFNTAAGEFKVSGNLV